MTRPELSRRFLLLTDALRYCRTRAYFSASQKTCLHMERAAIFHAQDYIGVSGDEARDPDYWIPAHLEVTLQQVKNDMGA